MFGMVSRPKVGPTYFFEAADGVRLYISIDFGWWKHLSFRKAHPPLFRPEPTSEGKWQATLIFSVKQGGLRLRLRQGKLFTFVRLGVRDSDGSQP